MDRELMKFLSNREPQVTTDIDVITAAVAVPLLYIENPRIVRGFSKSFSVASSKSYSFRVR